MTPLLLTAIGIICLFQALYIVQSFRVRILDQENPIPDYEALQPVSILIPLHNSASTIGLCLESILHNDAQVLKEVIIVLDRCADESPEIAQGFVPRFEAKGVDMKVVSLPSSRMGKVEAILEGGRYLSLSRVLLLDADIVLEPTALKELLNFHQAEKCTFSSCLVYPYQAPQQNNNQVQHLISNNRLYRQSVLQAVKNLHDVSNFPGGLQLVDFDEYRKLLSDGFLEDLVATYRVLEQGSRVAVFPRVLAYEVERQNISGLFLQRTRWTIGAIENFRLSLRTAKKRKGLLPKILIASYHVMWEFQHYAISFGLLLALFNAYYAPLFLLPFILYVVQIFRSAYLGRKKYRNSLEGILFHLFFYSFVLTAALLNSVFLIVKNRSFFFVSTALFKRE